MIEIPVSWGELLDKISILEIKADKIGDAEKRANVLRELALLGTRRTAAALLPETSRLAGELKAVNQALWEVEDRIRDCERAHDFGPSFIDLARSVYRTNDRRAALKRRIDEAMGSAIVEEKSYAAY